MIETPWKLTVCFFNRNFGVDLRRWEEVQLHQGKKVAEITVPPVLLAMLDHIQMGYASLPQQNGQRFPKLT